MLSSDSVTIRWRTTHPTDSIVRYGPSSTKLDMHQKTRGKRLDHEVKLTSLQPDTRYYYSLSYSLEQPSSKKTSVLTPPSEGFQFRTAPEIGSQKKTRVWVLGDSGTADRNARRVYEAYMAYPNALDTDVWLMLGDNAYYDGTDEEYQRAVFNMYPKLLRRVPLWSTLGNHDGRSAKSASQSGVYFDIFTLPTHAQVGGIASGTEAYYSFDHANIHFVCLDSHDSDRSKNSPMLRWLENDLAATKQTWIIAYWHHPPYSKGSHDSDTELPLREMRENALPILERYGVDITFSGHSHSYERSYLINGHYGLSKTFSKQHIVDEGDGRIEGDGAYQKSLQNFDNEALKKTHSGARTDTPTKIKNGAIYTVAGSSGKISGGPLDHPAMFTSLNQLGSVVLDIEGGSLRAKFLNHQGEITDHFSINKNLEKVMPSDAPVATKK